MGTAITTFKQTSFLKKIKICFLSTKRIRFSLLLYLHMNMHNLWVSKTLPVSRSGAALVSMFWFGEPLATPEIHKYIFFSVKVLSTLYSKLLLNLFFYFFCRTSEHLRSDATCHHHGNRGQSHARGGTGADGRHHCR